LFSSIPDTSVDSIADMLGVHRVTLGRLCRKEIKQSPKEYLTALRMEKAASMLDSTDIPIKEISRLSGLTNQITLRKCSKKHFGQPRWNTVENDHAEIASLIAFTGAD
jgi:transcriptional regulator GlxA family with amidase domain